MDKNGNQKIIYIKDSEIGNMLIPESLCVYQNKNRFMIVEVNTGYLYSQGCLRVVSESYHSVSELMRDPVRIASSYPFLHNHIIYNDKIMSAL